MSDIHLTEREWKSFCKNASYKSDPLTRALAALEKAEKAGPERMLEALAEVERQSDVLLKANKADKALAEYLGKVDKALVKARKEAEQAPREEAEDEEADDVLLDGKKLLAQLNLCRRDPERRAQFGFVDGSDKQPAVLALSPKLSGKKLFTRLQAATGSKTGAFGTAWVDGTALVLQLDKPLGGLVKKIRAPVKECGFRIAKAVLCNPDGSVFEQEEEGEETETSEASEAQTPPEAPPSSGGDEAAQAFKARLAGLIASLKSAPPTVLAEAKAQLGEAGVLARKPDFAAANALLARVQALIENAPSGSGGGVPPAAPPPAPRADEAATAFNTRLASVVQRVQAAKAANHPQIKLLTQHVAEAGALARTKDYAGANQLLDDLGPLLESPLPDEAARAEAMDRYVSARALVVQRLQQLAAAVRASGHNDADAALIEIRAVQANLSARPAGLQAVNELAAYLESDDVVADVDGANPFGLNIDLQQTLLPAVYELQAALS